jgi:hypothetical protein
MKKMLLDVIIAVITYYIVSIFMTTLITSTSAMDTLIKTLVPIAVACVAVFVALKAIK